MRILLILCFILQISYSLAQLDTNNIMNTTPKLTFIENKAAKLISLTSLKSKEYKIENIEVPVFQLVPNSSDDARKHLYLTGIAVLGNPYLNKTGVFIDAGDLYYCDNSEMVQFEILPGGSMRWRTNCVELNVFEKNSNAAISQFQMKIQKKEIKEDDYRKSAGYINLARATPAYFFSDNSNPGGGIVMPSAEPINMADGILKIAIKNPVTKKMALVFIDIKSKKVIESVVDGQEMDLNTGKPFASPLKDN